MVDFPLHPHTGLFSFVAQSPLYSDSYCFVLLTIVFLHFTKCKPFEHFSHSSSVSINFYLRRTFFFFQVPCFSNLCAPVWPLPNHRAGP